MHRTTFDDGRETDRLRAQRLIVKGRFLGGGIGYVLADDLALYANTFRRPATGLNETQRAVFDVVKNVGPITPRQIKEETGLLNKEIMPALHKLQKAFLVYEDQVDNDWERAWYNFETEWPEISLTQDQFQPAAIQVLRRFLKSNVFATFEQVKDWSQLAAKSLEKLLQEMLSRGLITPLTVKGLGDGWICPDDTSLKPGKPPAAVFMIHKGDVLSKSHTTELKRRFGKREVLQYLLIDGGFQGAVLGRWRIGPDDVEDIVVELPETQRAKRRNQILRAVAWGYPPPDHNILKYDVKSAASM